jgi:hypothetical protein
MRVHAFDGQVPPSLREGFVYLPLAELAFALALD